MKREIRIGGAAGFPATFDAKTGVLELEGAQGVGRSALEHLLALEGFRNPLFLGREGGAVRFRTSARNLSSPPAP